MTLIFVVILMALVFEYINGFHDTANSIATVVATRVLTPRQAVVMAACTNLIGALWGTAVATTIASGLIDPRVASQEVLICALLGAIVWNLVTWRAGLPSSSSHALVGGLVGAAVAAARRLERRHLVAARSRRTGIPAKDCCGKSSFRCSHRRCPASCSVSSSWVCCTRCCATGSRAR